MKQTSMVYFILINCLILTLGCEKVIEAGTSEEQTFFKVLSRDSSHTVLNMTELDNGSLLLLERWYNGKTINFTLLDQKARLIERRPFSFPLTGSRNWKVKKLRSGDLFYYLTGGGYIQKYAQDGSSIWFTKIGINDYYYFFEPMESPVGELYLPATQLGIVGYYGIIFKLDEGGNLIGNYELTATSLRSFETLEVIEQRGDTLLLVASTTPLLKNNDRAKLTFLTYQMSTDSVLSKQIFDEQDNSESDFVIGLCPTEDGEVCLTSGNRNNSVNAYNPSSEFELFFLNHRGGLIKRQRYSLGTYNCSPKRMVKTKDNGFLICGYVNSTRTDHYYGFMMKLNAQGEVEASRIFEETQMVLYDCLETQGGYFLFGGAAVGFGSGKDYVDGIVLKTDRSGKIH